MGTIIKFFLQSVFILFLTIISSSCALLTLIYMELNSSSNPSSYSSLSASSLSSSAGSQAAVIATIQIFGPVTNGSGDSGPLSWYYFTNGYEAKPVFSNQLYWQGLYSLNNIVFSNIAISNGAVFVLAHTETSTNLTRTISFYDNKNALISSFTLTSSNSSYILYSGATDSNFALFTYDGTTVKLSNRYLGKISITGTPTGGGYSSSISWRGLTTSNTLDVVNMNSAGQKYLIEVNCPDTTPLISSCQFTGNIGPGVCFTLTGDEGGAACTRNFWFYDQFGVYITNHILSRSDVTCFFYNSSTNPAVFSNTGLGVSLIP